MSEKKKAPHPYSNTRPEIVKKLRELLDKKHSEQQPKPPAKS